MMWKKVLIFLALVHVSWASPTELPPSSDEEVTESTTTSPTGNSDVVVVEAAADENVEDEEMESGTESAEAREFDPNDCFLEKSTGPCRAVIDSWFFNVATKSCESFMWSGCGGNKNRFKDKIQCENQCIKSAESTSSNNDTVMILNASSTTTAAATTTSTTDVSPAAAATTTTPSGTTGANSAESLTATTASSTTTTSTSTTTSPTAETTAAAAAAATTTSTTVATTTVVPKKKIECPKFEGCAAKCIVVQEQSTGGCKKCQCPLPTDSETSSVKITRSVSKAEVSAAKSPSIGSVSGLPVNTAEEESSEDVTERPEEICKLPATRGHCRAMMTRYRYDPAVKDCVQFHFGGCEGNANNFVTKEKCMAFCNGQ